MYGRWQQVKRPILIVYSCACGFVCILMLVTWFMSDRFDASTRSVFAAGLARMLAPVSGVLLCLGGLVDGWSKTIGDSMRTRICAVSMFIVLFVAILLGSY